MYGQPRMRLRPCYEMFRLPVTGTRRACGAQVRSQSDSGPEIYTSASLNPEVDPIDRTKLKELFSGARGEIQVKPILGLPASRPELILQYFVLLMCPYMCCE